MALSSSNMIDALGIFAGKYFSEGIIATDYTKVVRSVPEETQNTVKESVNKVKEMVFADFVLVANRQDDANTIYSSSRIG